MGEYKRILLLVVIMSVVALSVGGLAIAVLYETALGQQRESLSLLLQRQARLLDAFVRHAERAGQTHDAAVAAAIARLAEAQRSFDEPTLGEPSLARRQGERIVLVERVARGPGATANDDAADAPFAQAQRRAIEGESGSLITVDDQGRDVLVVYEPFPAGGLGMVVALPLAGIRAPFLRAGLAIAMLSFVAIALGTSLFFSVSEPMIAELRGRAQRFRDLFENMNCGALVLRPVDGARDFRVHDVNAAAEAIEGVARADVIGRRLTEAFPGVAETALLEALRVTAVSGAPCDIPEFHYSDARASGWREYRLYRLGGGEVVSLFNDVSQRKATEEQLLQAQKMEVVGQLTGGVAHDFNNVLAIILGNLQLLKERPDFDDETRALIGDALWSAERGAELTHRLLAFARRQPLHPSLMDVNDLVRRMLRLLRRTLGSGVVIEAELLADPSLTLMDQGQLDNALMNLIVNARDALPETGGEVVIETRNVTLDADRDGRPTTVDGQPLPNGDYIAVSVRDNGSGIAAEDRARIFEPFFTTKGPGRHSGLGLSMVYGFVRQSGGHIQVESEVGRGTVVTLYLPRPVADDDARAEPRKGDESVIAGVDDGERRAPALLRGPAPAVALALLLAAAIVPPAVTAAEDRRPITFAWRPADEARVTQRTLRRGQDVVLRYTLVVERASGGETWVRARDAEVLTIDGTPPRGDPAAHGVASLLAGVTPSLRVAADGRLLQVAGLDAMLDMMAGSLADHPREREVLRAEETLSPIRKAIADDAAERWRAWVGLWAGLALAPGVPIRVDRVLDVGGVAVPAPIVLRHLGGSNACAGCVWLRAASSLAGEALRHAFIAEWASLLASEEDRGDGATLLSKVRAVRRDTAIDAVTDPSTLKPVSVLSQSRTVVTFHDRPAYEQVERSETRFEWRAGAFAGDKDKP